jgi:hypothetical protein
MYGLTSQLRRAAVAIPSNVSEGHQHGTKRWPILPVMCGVSFRGCADRSPNGPVLDP